MKIELTLGGALGFQSPANEKRKVLETHVYKNMKDINKIRHYVLKNYKMRKKWKINSIIVIFHLLYFLLKTYFD